MNRKTGFNLAYVFVATAGVLVLHSLILRVTQVPEITYDEFQKHLKDNKVRDVVIFDRHVSGTIVSAEGKEQKFVAARVEGDLAKELGQYDVKFRRQIESTFLRDLLSNLLGLVPKSVAGRVLTATAMNAHNTVDAPDAVKPVAFDGASLKGDTLDVRLPAKSVVVLALK